MKEGKKKNTDWSIFIHSCLFHHLFGRLTSVTFCFLDNRDESRFGNFFLFAFAKVIAYCQVVDSVHVFYSLFFLILKLFYVFYKTTAVQSLQFMALPDAFSSN